MRKFGLTAIVFAALLVPLSMAGCSSDDNPTNSNPENGAQNGANEGANNAISLFDTLSVPSAANLPT